MECFNYGMAKMNKEFKNPKQKLKIAGILCNLVHFSAETDVFYLPGRRWLDWLFGRQPTMVVFAQGKPELLRLEKRIQGSVSDRLD